MSKPVSGIILTDVADHFGIFHIINGSVRNTNKSSMTMKRKFTEANMARFKQLLSDKDFLETINYNCPNSAYNNFISTFKEVFNIAFPPTKTRFNKKYMKREPWISAGLLTSSRHKSKLFKKKLLKPTDENIKSYKDVQGRTLKRNYYFHMLELNKNNMKKMWTVLKQAIGKHNDKSYLPKTF